MIDYDSELRRHHRRFRGALGLHHRDRVLDIGCGAGETTRDAATVASDGSVLGVDTAEEALRRARRLTRAAALGNVHYLRADAARPPFRPASFDVAISRFGTMFFAEPARAFTNLHGVLRPGGRLVMIVWQAAARNAWWVAIDRALAGDDGVAPAPELGPSPFSLGDAPAVERLLRGAAFADVGFEAVDEPVYYGPDVEHALALVTRFASVAGVLDSQSGGTRERTLARLREAMAAHRASDGVWLGSRAWIVTARRA